MKIVLISYGIIEFDGRLRELISVAESMGETFVFCRSNEQSTNSNYTFVKKNTKYISFIREVKKKFKKFDNIDILWADNRKGILPVLLLRKYHKKSFLICDSRELYVSSDVKRISSKIGCLIEKIFNKKFDVVICANEERSKIMFEKYSLNKKPIVFENVRRIKSDKSVDVDFKKKIDSIVMNHKWIFIGTSGCSVARGTLDIAKAIGEIGKDCGLFLVGSNSKKDENELMKLSDDNHYENIYMIPQLSQENLKYIIDCSNVGIVNYHMNDLNNKYCASGKIYEFIFEGIPILCSPNPPLYNFCKKYNVGISSDDYKNSIIELTKQYDFYKQNAVTLANKISDISCRDELKNNLYQAFDKGGK